MATPEPDRRTVLHVISSLGQLGGGAERQLLLYFQHRTGRWNHVVAYRKPQGLLREAIEAAGVKTMWLGPGNAIRQLRRLVHLARTESADVIHTYLWEANYLGRVAGRLLHLPVITTLTSTMESEDRVFSDRHGQAWKYRVALAFETLTARWGTSQFIAISEAVKESAVRTMGVVESRIKVVYRAVRSDGPNGIKATTAAPTLITTGRLVPNKGQELLIRMLPLVLREQPECVLQLVGTGGAQKTLERLANDLGVATHVRFLGLRSDVQLLLRTADLFVFASWYEGFANAFAEAIAGGMPVVAVSLPVFREIAPSSSVLLVERSEQAFADAVLRVLSDLDSFRAAARSASAPFRERFDVQRYVQETEAIYIDVLGPARERTRTRGAHA